MNTTLDNQRRIAYNRGWQPDGSWHCQCGTMIGKNLLGQRPWMLAWEHVKNCYDPLLTKNKEK